MKSLYIFFTVSLLLGCNMICPRESHTFELKVTNLSAIDIYPTVVSNDSKEKFGVVSEGKSATVGFSPFKIGEKIRIYWEEGERYDLSSFTIDSSSLLSAKSNVSSVHLIFYGHEKWVLKAFDENGTEIGSVP